jgi:hypothetical protein
MTAIAEPQERHKAAPTAAVLAFARDLTLHEQFQQAQTALFADIANRRVPLATRMWDLQAKRQTVQGAASQAGQRLDMGAFESLSAEWRTLGVEETEVRALLAPLDLEAQQAAMGTHPRLAPLQHSMTLAAEIVKREAFPAAMKKFNELLTLELRGAAWDVVQAAKLQLLRAPDAAVAIVAAPR